MSSFETITCEVADNVATITLNRPDSLNAMPPKMALEMAEAMGQLDGARALIITGAGRAFCSGADIAAGDGESIEGGEWAYKNMTQAYHPMLLKLCKLNIPVIAAVNGPAAGIGCSLALACDFTVASDKAYFLHAFVNIGLVSDGGSTWMLPRIIGKARALEMMLLGEKIPADKAVDWGMIYKAVEPEAVHGEAAALAAKLANGPTVALGLMRTGLADALQADYASILQMEAENQKIAGDSADAAEGIAAFGAKRKPNFQGK